MLLIHDLDLFTHGSQLRVDAHLHRLLTGGWRALSELRASGLIRAIGAGLNDAGTILPLLDATDLDFILLAMRYTLLEHDTLDVELPRCAERGVGMVIGGVFNSGITATGAVPGAYYNYTPATAEIIQRVGRIEAICRRHNVELPAAALQFPLGHPSVAAVIPGALSAKQVERNLAHFRQPIPAELWAELKAEKLIRGCAHAGLSRRCPIFSHIFERLRQVGDQVFDVLDADRDPDHVVADAHGVALLERDLLVGRGRRVDHQGLRVPDVGEV